MASASVLIVGGGIAGLTLAAALHRFGVEAELVERHPDWRALGAGIMVHANGMRALRALGLDAAVAAAGEIVPRWVFADQRGEVLFELDMATLWGDVGPSVGIARASLQRALLDGASAVPCRLGTSIAALIQGDRRVSVAFTDGSTGDYDLVVGADGIHSTVRRLAMSAAPPVYGGQMVWRSLAPMRLPGPPSVQLWLGDGCFFGLCSVGDGRSYGFGNVAAERQYDPEPGRLGRLRRRFDAFGPTVQAYLDALETDEQIHCSPIEWLERESWSAGRIVLIGDASHATSPMMGQGGCMAMEDAVVLAEVLATEPTVESALAVFADRRRPRVGLVRQGSQTVGEGLRAPPRVRDAALRERGAAMLRDRFRPLMERP